MFCEGCMKLFFSLPLISCTLEWISAVSYSFVLCINLLLLQLGIRIIFVSFLCYIKAIYLMKNILWNHSDCKVCYICKQARYNVFLIVTIIIYIEWRIQKTFLPSSIRFKKFIINFFQNKNFFVAKVCLLRKQF